MTLFGRVLTAVCTVATIGTATVYAAGTAPATKPATKPTDSTIAAGRQNISAEYKQINIINIDEGVFEKGRL